MSKTYIDPATDHVIVAESLQETVVGDITMPDNAKQKEMLTGTVIFVGPDAHRTEPHDIVLYGPYAGKNIYIDGIEFRLLVEGQIEAYVRKAQ